MVKSWFPAYIKRPDDIDRQVAKKLAGMQISIDAPTDEQGAHPY
jgi:hypothetical protein